MNAQSFKNAFSALKAELLIGLANPIARMLALTALAVVLTLLKVPADVRGQVLTVIAVVIGAALVSHGYKAGSSGVNVNLGQMASEVPQLAKFGDALSESQTEAQRAEASIEAAAPQTQNVQVNVSAPANPPTISTGVAVKIIALFLISSLMLGFATGCNPNNKPTPVQNVTMAYSAYAAALDVLTAAQNAGLVSPQLHDQIEPALNAIEAALSVARQGALAGDTNAAADGIQQAFAAISQLTPYINDLQAALQKKTKPMNKPTSQPALPPISTISDP